MPHLVDASPRCTVWLYKTIDRTQVDGQTPVSTRYAGKDKYIDLTPFLNDGSSVDTSKSVREPAGAWSVSFADAPQVDWVSGFMPPGAQSIESVYGLVEPMDVIEIRMWRGVGDQPSGYYPIIMRGFVSDVRRSQAMSPDGRPVRTVIVSGQDYGKIWQTYQVLHLPAYIEGKGLLTNFALAELFGVGVVNAMPAGEFVRTMVEKILNPHILGFMPPNLDLGCPLEIQTGDSIAVKHGQVNMSFQNMQGSIYDILRFHGDVGHWNELYTEDREDGVHCVYRPVPALHLAPQEGGRRLIQDDAVEPIYCEVFDSDVVSLSVARSDSTVANFFWVSNSRFDLIDDVSRRLFALAVDESSVSLRDYPNSAVKYYGVRPMYAETQQGGDEVTNQTGGLPEEAHKERGVKQEDWIAKRRRILMEMNRDNVVFERGTAVVKGCPMRPGGVEAMRAGDYVRFIMGRMIWDAYVVQIDHRFAPFQGYTTTLTFERGEGFALRMELGGGSQSPWLAEQVQRAGGIRL